MFKDIKIIKNYSFKDHRGFLWTTWKKGVFNKIKFNHDKFSLSKHKTLRGIHCDFKSWKMITCIYGKFLLVVVDMRKNSKNYLKHKKWTLDHKKPTLSDIEFDDIVHYAQEVYYTKLIEETPIGIEGEA